jgi:hypothetical protein
VSGTMCKTVGFGMRRLDAAFIPFETKSAAVKPAHSKT